MLNFVDIICLKSWNFKKLQGNEKVQRLLDVWKVEIWESYKGRKTTKISGCLKTWNLKKIIREGKYKD